MDYFKIIRYLISGGTATAADLLLLYFFTDVLGIWYLLSATLAFALALSISFLLQKFWTFKHMDTKTLHIQIMLYILTGAFSIGLNSVMMYTFVEFAGIHYLPSQIIGNVVIAIVNFLIYQRLIFKASHQELHK